MAGLFGDRLPIQLFEMCCRIYGYVGGLGDMAGRRAQGAEKSNLPRTAGRGRRERSPGRTAGDNIRQKKIVSNPVVTYSRRMVAGRGPPGLTSATICHVEPERLTTRGRPGRQARGR